jgi:ACDE family multidrug resistance protein
MAETKVYRNRNFQIICGVSLMGMMMAAIITPAFPTIMEALGISEQSIGLLISVYTFPNFLLLPLTGVMADRFGRKKLLVPALFLYGIFGGLCALAPDFKTLLILRALQGIGGAPLLPICNAIIGDLFSGQKRVEAMGFNTMVMYVGYVIYPLLGGALAGLAWNYAFLPYLTAIPVGIIALVSLHCPEPKSKENLKDYLRTALRYLKGLKVLWLFSATVITYILLFGAYQTYFSIFLEDRFAASSFTIGLFISVIGLVTAGASSQLGRFNQRFSVVSLIIGASIIYAVATAIIPLAPSLWFCLLPIILFSIGHGLNLPSQNIVAVGIAPSEHRAAFMGAQNTMIPLGMTIGPLIMGLALSFTDLNVTFIITALIALIIPIMAAIIGKGKLSAG